MVSCRSQVEVHNITNDNLDRRAKEPGEFCAVGIEVGADHALWR